MTLQTSKAHSFTPNANKSEFNCSKPFLCKGIDGSNPAARNLSTLVPVDQSVHRCCLDVDCFLDRQVRGVSGVVQHRGFFPLDEAVTVPSMFSYGRHVSELLLACILVFSESGLQAPGCLTDVCLTTGARDLVDDLGLEVRW